MMQRKTAENLSKSRGIYIWEKGGNKYSLKEATLGRTISFRGARLPTVMNTEPRGEVDGKEGGMQGIGHSSD